MRFVHFTQTLEDLHQILRTGLLITGRRRNVWKYFLRKRDFRDREPQQFGTASIHGFLFRPSKKCIEKFGGFGAELRPEWVVEHDFRKVIYIKDHGRIFRRIKEKVDEALEDLEGRLELEAQDDAFPRMAYTNRNVATWIGAQKWCEVVTAFESFEPWKHRYQREWRFSRQDPFYQSYTPKVVSEYKRLVKEDVGWIPRVSVIPLRPRDVSAIWVPKCAETDFLTSRDPQYGSVPIKYT